MGDKIETSLNTVDLSELEKQCRTAARKFGDIFWGKIRNHFPDDFDTQLLDLDNLLPNIMSNGEYMGGEDCHAIVIPQSDYDGGIGDLYEQIKGLNGANIDGFSLAIYKVNNEDSNTPKQVNIFIQKEDGKNIGEDQGVKDTTDKLLRG